SVAMPFVLVARGIDLSIGANLGVSGMVSAVVMSRLQHVLEGQDAIVIGIGVVIALLTGAFVGLVNGLLVTTLDVNPLIVTLGMSGVAFGATQLINGGQQLSDIPVGVQQIGNATIFGGWLPVPFLIAV